MGSPAKIPRSSLRRAGEATEVPVPKVIPPMTLSLLDGAVVPIPTKEFVVSRFRSPDSMFREFVEEFWKVYGEASSP